MTDLGLYFTRKSVNKAEVSRRSGISKARLTQLSNNTSTKLTVVELYKVALSIGADPCELLLAICKDITLKSSE